ncbi:MAG TPA: glycosyltransferase [Streptosporangiaceae bacterium]|nr:glycosyltransferase [Streptosporangiaceae bacterium]
MAENGILKVTGHDRQPSSQRVGRVVLMIGQLGMGGTEKQVVLLARGLRDRGIDISVWALYDSARNHHEDELRQSGINVVNVGLHGYREVCYTLQNIARIGGMVARLRRERPDIVHAFLFHTYVIAAPVARMARVPVLVAGRRSLGNFKEDRPMARVAERLATSATDLLIANAAAVAEDTKRRERVRESMIEVIYNGLPAQAFAQVSPADVETAGPLVLCVANLKRYKGHRYLLEAMSLLQRGGRACTLLLAGEGAERHALERQAGLLGIDVRFLGACDDVRPLLARADVVAHASLEEGMSNAVMEAMAAGRAVVATSVGGTPELLRGRGLLVPPADPAALADAIEQVLADRVLAGRLGAAARSWSRAHLSAGAMVDRHIQIYSDLMERRCAG